MSDNRHSVKLNLNRGKTAQCRALSNMGMFSRAHHHRYPANATVRLGTVNGERLILRTNEDGFRSSYSLAEFLAASPRIVVLGDSFVFGLGVQQGVEFTARREGMLKTETRNPALAVLNTAL